MMEGYVPMQLSNHYDMGSSNAKIINVGGGGGLEYWQNKQHKQPQNQCNKGINTII